MITASVKKELTAIAMHILTNISKNKDNQLMKFDQLIECNMRKILLEKSYTKCGGENNARLVAFTL